MISLHVLNPTTHVTISLTEFVRRRKRTPLTVLMIGEVSIVLYVFFFWTNFALRGSTDENGIS